MAKTKIVDKNALSQYTEEMKGYIKSQGLGLTKEDINGLIDIKLVPVNETIEDKVDKVDGMGLSTNDFTDEEKVKLDSIPSDAKFTDTVYDDTGLKELIADNTEAINAHKTAIDTTVTTLVGADTNKSVRTIANEELAAQLIPESAKESIDNLTKVAQWIQQHPDDAAAMNKEIEDLKVLVGTLPDNITATTIADYIGEVIESEKARAEGVESSLDDRLIIVEELVGEGFVPISTETIDGLFA